VRAARERGGLLLRGGGALNRRPDPPQAALGKLEVEDQRAVFLERLARGDEADGGLSRARGIRVRAGIGRPPAIAVPDPPVEVRCTTERSMMRARVRSSVSGICRPFAIVIERAGKRATTDRASTRE
jgi:hypothetical protein